MKGTVSLHGRFHIRRTKSHPVPVSGASLQRQSPFFPQATEEPQGAIQTGSGSGQGKRQSPQWPMAAGTLSAGPESRDQGRPEVRPCLVLPPRAVSRPDAVRGRSSCPASAQHCSKSLPLKRKTANTPPPNCRPRGLANGMQPVATFLSPNSADSVASIQKAALQRGPWLCPRTQGTRGQEGTSQRVLQ